MEKGGTRWEQRENFQWGKDKKSFLKKEKKGCTGKIGKRYKGGRRKKIEKPSV